jgi:hypothetical protein
VNHARRDLCGGHPVMDVPTAIGDPFCSLVPADELQVEDILEVEHDFIPLDGADVFQWREIDSIGDRVALAEAGRFPAACASAEPPCADSLATSQHGSARSLKGAIFDGKEPRLARQPGPPAGY